MADPESTACSPSGGSKAESFFSQAAQVVQAAKVVAAVSQAVMRDGHIAAMGRQGAGELGQALKAFPESVQNDTPGTLFNPTQGEIAKSRDAGVHGADDRPSQAKVGPPTPSEIAKEGSMRGSTGNNPAGLPSPSEIARENPQDQVLTQQDKGWADRVKEERKGNQDGNADEDQNQRGRGRSLADEQRDRKRQEDQGRGR